MAKAKRKPRKRAKTPAKKRSTRTAPEVCTCPKGAKMVYAENGDYAENGGVCRTNQGKGKRVATVCKVWSVTTRSVNESPSYRIGKPKMGKQLATPAAFDYWTPSTVTPSTAAQRRKRGCVVETISYVSKKGKGKGQTKTKKVPLPYRCPPGSKPNEADGTCLEPGGASVEPIRDPQCGKQANPCAQKRKTCPVQLVYRGGKPQLRFCVKAGNKKPGFLVPVKNASEANRLAEGACAHWRKSRKRFTKQNPAYKLATAAYPESEGLGGKRKARRKAGR